MQKDTIRRQLRSLAVGERRDIAGVRVRRPGAAELYDVAGLGAAWELDLDLAEQAIRMLDGAEEHPVRAVRGRPSKGAVG